MPLLEGPSPEALLSNQAAHPVSSIRFEALRQLGRLHNALIRSAAGGMQSANAAVAWNAMSDQAVVSPTLWSR